MPAENFETNPSTEAAEQAVCGVQNWKDFGAIQGGAYFHGRGICPEKNIKRHKETWDADMSYYKMHVKSCKGGFLNLVGSSTLILVAKKPAINIMFINGRRLDSFGEIKTSC